MDVQELANAAAQTINYKSAVAMSGDPILQLVMPHRKTAYRHRYLAGKNSPKGEYLSFTKDGEIINFNAIDVLAWCVANGALVEIKRQGEQMAEDYDLEYREDEEE